jgi:uncharacterized protein (DUF433 family)
MPLKIHSDTSVFRLGDVDTIRIGETRVTLDTLIAVFNNGETPEQIQQNFPTLDLADIYSALGYYIRHRAEVDAYLEARDREADEIVRLSPIFNGGIREKILARRAAQEQPAT